MHSTKKIAVIFGTRPEIIKMMPIILACEDKGLDYFMIHSGQHYSYEMDKVFFKELNLPHPKYNVRIGSGAQGKQTGEMLKEIEKILTNEKPDVVLVQGDTNTVLAGALAATKLHISVGHIEAGLRSFDRRMPEEINRILTDHIADYLFVPTNSSRKLLLNEGISNEKIYVTGNTIVDSVLLNIERAKKTSKIIDKLNITRASYALLTLHRAENVDNMSVMKDILSALDRLKQHDMKLVWPMHPRTEKELKRFKLLAKVKQMAHVKITKPVGFYDFLMLESNASFIMTDSGGVQEEACILKIPCVTLRKSTERPETISVGANRLVGNDPIKIIAEIDKIIKFKSRRQWKNPFGDGKSGRRIVEIIENHGAQPETRPWRIRIHNMAKATVSTMWL